MVKNVLIDILSICADEFDVRIEDVLSRCRKQELVFCRKAFCYIVKEIFDLKYELIGSMINRTGSAASLFVISQPNDRYYKYCMYRIKHRIKNKQYASKILETECPQ